MDAALSEPINIVSLMREADSEPDGAARLFSCLLLQTISENQTKTLLDLQQIVVVFNARQALNVSTRTLKIMAFAIFGQAMYVCGTVENLATTFA